MAPESDIPSVIQNGKLLIRGSDAWEHREINRMFAGYYCLSGGTIDEALAYEKQVRTRGRPRHIVRR